MHHSVVIPIYFWASREGGSMSREAMRKINFKMIAFYPRRPKVSEIHDDEVEVKFNQHLFIRANTLLEAGIPVFAGVPLISNIFEARSNCDCAWFQINQEGQEESLTLEIKAKTLISSKSVNQIQLTDFESIIDTQCKLLNGEDIIKIIRSFKRDFDSDFYTSIWGDTYKPIYFLIES
jgi:hypothetical protein